MITRGRQITTFHTHLHLGPLPDHQNHLWFLDHLIHQEVAPKVRNLLKTTTEGNKGVVIKPWVWDHHAFYNLKDYHSYRHHQDADLVIDYLNSNLVFPTEKIEITTFHPPMKTKSRPDQCNITLFFGKRNQITLEKFDHLSEELRRSRTGTLDYLITPYEFYNKSTPGRRP